MTSAESWVQFIGEYSITCVQAFTCSNLTEHIIQITWFTIKYVSTVLTSGGLSRDGNNNNIRIRETRKIKTIGP